MKVLLLSLLIVGLNAASFCVDVFAGKTDCTGQYARCSMVDTNACTALCEHIQKQGVDYIAYKWQGPANSFKLYTTADCTGTATDFPTKAVGQCQDIAVKLASIKVATGACAAEAGAATAGIKLQGYTDAACTTAGNSQYFAFEFLKANRDLTNGCLQTGTNDSQSIKCTNVGVEYRSYSSSTNCTGNHVLKVLRADGACYAETNQAGTGTGTSGKVSVNVAAIGQICTAATTVAPATSSVSAFALSALSLLMFFL